MGRSTDDQGRHLVHDQVSVRQSARPSPGREDDMIRKWQERKLDREIEARSMAKVAHYFRNDQCDHTLVKHAIADTVDAYRCTTCGMVGWVSPTVVGQVSVGWRR